MMLQQNWNNTKYIKYMKKIELKSIYYLLQKALFGLAADVGDQKSHFQCSQFRIEILTNSNIFFKKKVASKILGGNLLHLDVKNVSYIQY